ncbi:MAG: hypothetical protein ACJAS4_003355 [Bacteriovoracaceae bacterium]|jgi:hypothetical protein
MKKVFFGLALIISMSSFASIDEVQFKSEVEYDGIMRSVVYVKGKQVKLTEATGKDHCEVVAATHRSTDKIEKGTVLEVESAGPVDHDYIGVVAHYKIKFKKNDLKVIAISCTSLRKAQDGLTKEDVQNTLRNIVTLN